MEPQGFEGKRDQLLEPSGPLAKIDALLYVWLYSSYYIPYWKSEPALKDLCEMMMQYKEMVFHFEKDLDMNGGKIDRKLKGSLSTIVLLLEGISKRASENIGLIRKHELRKNAFLTVLKEALATAEELV